MKYFYTKLHNIFKQSSATFYAYYGERYTYRDCYTNMLKINSILGNIRNKRIMLYASKCFNAYSAIYSILLSENIWIPISPSQPSNRILEMLNVAAPYMILTDDKLPQTIREYAKGNNIKLLNINEIINEDSKEEFRLGDFKKDNIAYIMFTSGSTGVPKGVPMTHENYINFVENAMEILPFNRGEVFSDYHDFAFDLSIFYLFCAPLTESALAPVMDKERLMPLKNIISNKVTVWSSVPTAISLIKKLRPNKKINTSIKIMFVCGEPFKLDILRYCYENMEVDHVYNFYGLTETGVENYYYECCYDDLKRFEKQGVVPIGRPLKGNKITVADNKELLLSGCQITPGYLGGREKERFKIIDGERWYLTGDMVEKYEDLYFCKGRLDSQVKISGYRIELIDIESQIRRFDGINDVLCFVETFQGQNILIAVLAAEKLDLEKLMSFLKELLPLYMIPRRFFVMDKFPINPNGKIDRKKIKNLYRESINLNS